MDSVVILMDCDGFW